MAEGTQSWSSSPMKSCSGSEKWRKHFWSKIFPGHQDVHLKISELQGCGWVAYDLRRLSQSSRCFLLSFGSDDFGTSFPWGLRLKGRWFISFQGSFTLCSNKSSLHTSAAMALCSWTGKRTSLLKRENGSFENICVLSLAKHLRRLFSSFLLLGFIRFGDINYKSPLISR